MFETRFVAREAEPGSFSLVGVSILIDRNDYEGVHVAARTLAHDFAKVTGGKDSVLAYNTPSSSFASTKSAIIIGSLPKSSILQSLVEQKKLDVSAIEGQWECFTTQLISHPFEGCENALVIVGSDKRGAIFGTYTLSGQIGISPYVDRFTLNPTGISIQIAYAVDVPGSTSGPIRPLTRLLSCMLWISQPAMAHPRSDIEVSSSTMRRPALLAGFRRTLAPSTTPSSTRRSLSLFCG